MNKIITRILPLAFTFLYVLDVSAQTGCTGGTGPGGGGSTPIDGGVSALLVGAGVLGYKYLRDKKK